MNNKKTISILMIFTVIFTVIGGSLAYWTWNTSEAQKTNIVFTLERDFSCAVDGGGNITETDVTLAPTTCTDTERAIKREVKVTPTLNRDDLTINMDLWLDVNSIGSGLSESQNFKYVLTTSSISCEEGTILSLGTFNEKTAGSRVEIMNKKTYTKTVTDTYYLYIWLDEKETNSNTMNQTFSLSLNGSCTNSPQPEAPDLDNGMIPVTISENGTVKTVDKDDASWYDYDEKQWANAILVNSEKRSSYLNTNGVTVSQDDILAYYVWIPRYSYMMPSGKCSSVVSPSLTGTPECYAPYTISESDKPNLIAFIHTLITQYVGITDYTQEQAAAGLENALQTGRYVVEYMGMEQSMTIGEVIQTYNSEVGANVILENSEFNGNNIVESNIPRPIEIMFESKTAALSLGNAVKTYKTHPAFWWDNDSDGVVDSGETVAGIWVGKFETSANKESTCYTSNSTNNCLPANVSPRIVPNVKSLRNQTVSNQFTTSQKFTSSGNEYGLSSTSTNAHMMKNSEWGAVAYLSHSAYGINQEIYINNSSNYFTGRSGGNVGGSVKTVEEQFSGQTSTNQYNNYGYYTWLGQNVDINGNIGSYASDRKLGTNASATGNVTGVYDMSGGAWEYVMGHYGNTITEKDYSGFTTMPDSKYYNLYSTSQFTGDYNSNMALCTLETCGGHALNETANWYKDFSLFVNSDNPWFSRGGDNIVGAYASSFYSFCGAGNDSGDVSWRSVLVVGYGA